MTRQQQNDIIIGHLNAELKDKPDIRIRVGTVFNQWFQALVNMGTQPPASAAEEQQSE